MAKYDFQSDYTYILGSLRMSRNNKIKHGWSRENGAGFICEDISDVKRSEQITETVRNGEVIKTTKKKAITIIMDEGHTEHQTTVPELNLRETEEMIKFCEIQQLKEHAQSLSMKVNN